MSASSSFPNRLTGVTVVLPGDLLRGVTDPEVGGREVLRMKNPFARQREEGLQHAQESGEATVCRTEGEGLQSAQQRGRGYSLHKRGGGATVYLREEAGLKSSQKKGRDYSLHKRGVCTCECLPREGGGVDYLQ